MLDANPKTSVTHKLKRGCIKTFILIQPLLYVGMTGILKYNLICLNNLIYCFILYVYQSYILHKIK